MWKIIKSESEKRAIYDKVRGMIHDTYVNNGCSDFNVSADNLCCTPGAWKLFYDGSYLVGGLIYRACHGNKLRVLFHNGSRHVKDAVMQQLTYDLNHNGFWVEASGRVREILMNNGISSIKAIKANQYISDNQFFQIDEVTYKRYFCDKMSKPLTILGNPR